MASLITPDLNTIYQKVSNLIDLERMDLVITLLQEEHPADIADLLGMFNEDKQVLLFNLLEPEFASEVLDEMDTRSTRDLVDAIDDERIADLLEVLPADDAAELLLELEDDRAEDILELMEPEEASEVEALLAYPENSAGRLMSSKVVRLNERMTVEETLNFLPTIDPETETLAYLYVVNGLGRLVGVVPLRNLVTSKRDATLGELMEDSVVSVRVDTDQEEVARQVSQYDFYAIPVVDEDGVLLGIITHDDVVDILQEEFTEDMQRLGGSLPLEGEYLSTPVLTIAGKRIGWLLVLFLTQMLTGTVMRVFEVELASMVALTFFIPLLIGTGGNSGSQTTSTIIRAIGTGELGYKDAWLALWRESRTGFILGLVMSVVGFMRALMWGYTIDLGITVAAALFTIVLWANIIGAMLPLLAARLKIDPAVISGPVMSTLVDATGLFIYFSLARLLIRF